MDRDPRCRVVRAPEPGLYAVPREGAQWPHGSPPDPRSGRDCRGVLRGVRVAGSSRDPVVPGAAPARAGAGPAGPVPGSDPQGKPETLKRRSGLLRSARRGRALDGTALNASATNPAGQQPQALKEGGGYRASTLAGAGRTRVMPRHGSGSISLLVVRLSGRDRLPGCRRAVHRGDAPAVQLRVAIEVADCGGHEDLGVVRA